MADFRLRNLEFTAPRAIDRSQPAKRLVRLHHPPCELAAVVIGQHRPLAGVESVDAILRADLAEEFRWVADPSDGNVVQAVGLRGFRLVKARLTLDQRINGDQAVPCLLGRFKVPRLSASASCFVMSTLFWSGFESFNCFCNASRRLVELPIVTSISLSFAYRS